MTIARTNVFYALSEHHLVEDFTTGLANESVSPWSELVPVVSPWGCIRLIHVTPPGVNEGLDMALVLVGIEGRAGDVARLAATRESVSLIVSLCVFGFAVAFGQSSL